MDVTTDAMVEAIDQLNAIENGVRAKLLREVAAYDKCEGWREDGACSMTDWLMYRRGFARRTAAEIVRVAKTLPALPRIAEALEAGRLSWDKVALITTIAIAEDDAWWAELAEMSSVAYLESIVRYRRGLKRSDAERQVGERYLDMRWDDHKGVLRLNGRLPGADGALVKKAIERIAEQAPLEPGSDRYQPHHHRCADALVELASATTAAECDPDRAAVVVHVDARDLNAVHGVATLEDGPPIAAEVARRLSCDGRVQLVASAPDGQPIGVGRTARTVPPWLARELRRRDGGCRFAECGRTRGVQAHHVIHWAHGGSTDIDNLVLLCRYHHRLVHEGGFRVVKDARSELRFIRPTGHPIPARAPSIRPEIRERLFGPPKHKANQPRRRPAARRATADRHPLLM
jgi:hypothetical protein